MPLYLVDTIVSYRIKYLIEAKEKEHALDEIVWSEGLLNELTQRCLGEQTIDSREVTIEQAKHLLEELKNDSSELSSYWMGDKLINKVKYDENTDSQ